MGENRQLAQLDLKLFQKSIVDSVLQELKDLHSDKQSEGEKRNRSLRQKLAEDVPLTGLNEAVKSKRITATVFWTVVFLACLMGTVYFIYRVLEEFMADTTATKVKLVRQNEYEFPPFVLCVDTWLNMEKATRMGFTKASIRYALTYLVAPYEVLGAALSVLSSMDFFDEEERPSILRAPYRSRTYDNAKATFEEAYARNNFSNLLEFFEQISLDAVKSSTRPDEIQFDCVFCKHQTLTKVIIGHDVCYQIELWSVDAKKGHASGWYPFVVRVPDLSEGITSRREYSKLYVSPRIIQFVQPGTFMSMNHWHTHTIRVATEHAISLNKTKEPCVENGEYSRRACAVDCYAKLIKTAKNCTIFNLDIDRNGTLMDYCNTYDMENWIGQFVDHIIKFVKNVPEENLAECLEPCLPECDVWRYKTDVDIHRSHRLKKSSVKGNMTSTKIFFVNADVMAGGILTLEEVDPYSFETLVSNIGGVCGIWIGASVMTFVQLVAFCSKLFVGCGKRKWKPNQHERREQTPMLIAD